MASSAETFSVRLPDELRDEVARLAAATKRSRAFIVKEAVAAYVADRRSFLAAIDQAETEADAGVFVSGKAVTAWLSSWGAEAPAPPPKPDVNLKRTS